MSLSLARCSALALALALGACGSTPPAPPPAAAAPPPPPPPPPPRVVPIEAEPAAPATLGWSFFQRNADTVGGMLAYADRVRALNPNELGAEISRLGDPGDAPVPQMQLALALVQKSNPTDTARALGLLQKVLANPTSDAQPLHPLARVLATRLQEQRKVEEERDRQAQQLRDAQRRIDQLNDRIEALRAIERSFSRPNSHPSAAPRPSQ